MAKCQAGGTCSPVSRSSTDQPGNSLREHFKPDAIKAKFHKFFFTKNEIIIIIIIVDRFYIALFSALEQTHCARM